MTDDFTKHLKVDSITRKETQKKEGTTEETAVTLKGADSIITIKGDPNDLEYFIQGTEVILTITQAQKKLKV